jgi:hypothetical protein
MSMYYFHIKDGKIILDDVGSEHSNLANVQKESLKACREMVTGSPGFWAGEQWELWVTDKPNGAGTTILTLRISGEMAA